MFSDSKGKFSMGRFGLFIILLAGLIVVSCGLVGWFLDKGDALAVIGLGASSFLSIFAKSLQSFAERRKSENS